MRNEEEEIGLTFWVSIAPTNVKVAYMPQTYLELCGTVSKVYAKQKTYVSIKYDDENHSTRTGDGWHRTGGKTIPLKYVIFRLWTSPD